MKVIQTLLSILFVVFTISFHAVPAHAGPYTDDLTRCIVESTTANDRIEFVKWMFFAISMHPVAKNYSSVSEEKIADANKKIAKLMMKLLTESCKEKAEKAIKYEGQIALQTSFRTLGQVAAQDLFTNPDVAAVISGLEKYLDGEKLKSSLGIK